MEVSESQTETDNEDVEVLCRTVVLFGLGETHWEPLYLDNPHIKNLGLDEKTGYLSVEVSCRPNT